MKGHKRDRKILASPGRVLPLPVDAKYKVESPDLSLAREEEDFVRKFLKLADIALKPSFTKSKKVA